MRHKRSICAFNSTHRDAYIINEMMFNTEGQLNLYGKAPGSEFLECS